LQVLGAGQGYLADRFTYIAYFGLFFILGHLLDKSEASAKFKTVALIGSALATLIYSYMTFQQNKIWKNSDTLWSHVLNYYQKTTLPWGNRANYRRSKGMIREALGDYNKAISLKHDPQTFNSRARLYFDIAKNSRDTLLMALSDYNKAIELKPKDGEFHINRGATYARLGDMAKAIEDINLGLKYKPDHATGYLNRFVLNLNAGKPKEALADISKYIEFIPYEANAWYEKARLERTMIEMDKALISFAKAMDLNPQNGLFYYERARTYYAMSKMPEAKQDLRTAMQLGYKNIEPDMQPILAQ
jgi:tetratricopeptide (TPR) repeat protein